MNISKQQKTTFSYMWCKKNDSLYFIARWENNSFLGVVEQWGSTQIFVHSNAHLLGEANFNSFGTTCTLSCRIVVALRLLIFSFFSKGYSLIWEATFINFNTSNIYGLCIFFFQFSHACASFLQTVCILRGTRKYYTFV